MYCFESLNKLKYGCGTSVFKVDFVYVGHTVALVLHACASNDFSFICRQMSSLFHADVGRRGGNSPYCIWYNF